MPKIKLAPSILSADFSKINDEIDEVAKYSQLIHVDIMDGVFVPPTTVDSNFMKTIKTKIPLDAHLMVHEPSDAYIKGFIDAGAASITIHEEACKNPKHQINFIKKHKIKAAISIKPNTPFEKLLPYIDDVDMVLIMTVEPGWAGQKFMDAMMPKVSKLRQMRPNLDIQVDGGITPMTIRTAYEAGANVFVAGSSIYGQKDRIKAINDLMGSLK